MPENPAMDTMRDEYDIDTLIEQATPILRRYILTLEQENAVLRQELMDLQGITTRRERAALAREAANLRPARPCPRPAMATT